MRRPTAGKAWLQRQLVEIHVWQTEMSRRQSRDTIRPRSWPTDAASGQGTAVPSRAVICIQGQQV